ncbi:MAG: acyltransferase [Rikenellaceae bacterium]
MGNGVQYKHFRTTGTPYVMVANGGKCTIGNNFAMNNGIKGNPIGCYNKCTIVVDRGGELNIGDNVGISQTAIICHKSITIGRDVKIGGGVCIYDTDFHSLSSAVRRSTEDVQNKIVKPVVICDNVFIGAHSIVLKGVTIGENSIVGAGSVVTKSIPANQIWAGNPAKFIKDTN